MRTHARTHAPAQKTKEPFKIQINTCTHTRTQHQAAGERGRRSHAVASTEICGVHACVLLHARMLLHARACMAVAGRRQPPQPHLVCRAQLPVARCELPVAKSQVTSNQVTSYKEQLPECERQL